MRRGDRGRLQLEFGTAAGLHHDRRGHRDLAVEIGPVRARRDIVAKKAMDIVQPDLCAAGGFSECLKIASLASAHGVECVPHAWGSAIGLAATVQFIAALGDQPPAWRSMPPMLEFEQTPNPLRDHLAKEPIEQRNGIVAVPDAPGIGIEVDRDVLAKYKVA